MKSYYHIDSGYRRSRRISFFHLLILSIAVFSCGLVYQSQKDEGSTGINNNVAAEQLSTVAPVKTKLDVPMKWPNYGHSAFSVSKNDKVAASTSDASSKQVPTASLAKVITALAILKQKPLEKGSQGPTLTLTDADVALYGHYINKNGSVALVEPGEQITQYQAMQAMLMTSANNVTDSLAIWAFGSIEEYNNYANKMVKEMGLNNTKITDASGFSPNTVSSADDLAVLGILYMQNPVLREIATQTEATIPVAGKIPNYNSLVNQDNIYGIKVGDTDEAGRCFMVARLDSPGTPNENISTAVILGADHLSTAMKDGRDVLLAGNNAYNQSTSN